jgi:hypothetical protein
MCLGRQKTPHTRLIRITKRGKRISWCSIRRIAGIKPLPLLLFLFFPSSSIFINNVEPKADWKTAMWPACLRSSKPKTRGGMNRISVKRRIVIRPYESQTMCLQYQKASPEQYMEQQKRDGNGLMVWDTKGGMAINPSSSFCSSSSSSCVENVVPNRRGVTVMGFACPRLSKVQKSFGLSSCGEKTLAQNHSGRGKCVWGTRNPVLIPR